MNTAHPPFDPGVFGPDALIMKGIDGTNWRLRTASGPVPRYGTALAYADGIARTVMYGGYNGSGYRKNRYDEKLAKAYKNRPRDEKRTPATPTAQELLSRYAQRPPVDEILDELAAIGQEIENTPEVVKPDRNVLGFWQLLRRFLKWLAS